MEKILSGRERQIARKQDDDTSNLDQQLVQSLESVRVKRVKVIHSIDERLHITQDIKKQKQDIQKHKSKRSEMEEDLEEAKKMVQKMEENFRIHKKGGKPLENRLKHLLEKRKKAEKTTKEKAGDDEKKNEEKLAETKELHEKSLEQIDVMIAQAKGE